MVPGVNISEKSSVASIKGAEGSGGCSKPLSRGLGNFLGSKEHLDWLK